MVKWITIAGSLVMSASPLKSQEHDHADSRPCGGQHERPRLAGGALSRHADSAAPGLGSLAHGGVHDSIHGRYRELDLPASATCRTSLCRNSLSTPAWWQSG